MAFGEIGIERLCFLAITKGIAYPVVSFGELLIANPVGIA